MTFRFRFLNSLFFVLVGGIIIASIGLAYNSSGPPDVMGHSPDEIALNFVKVTTDCSTSGATICEAACPASSGMITYHVVSGGCISQNAMYWRQMGQCDYGACGSSSGNSWQCEDTTHVATPAGTRSLIAYVTCLKGGQ